MSNTNVSESIKEVVETSEEVKDKAVETAEQTVETVTEVTPVVVEEKKGFVQNTIDTSVEIVAHVRPIVKKLLVGGALVGIAVLAAKALSPKPSEEEVIATEDQDYDSNVIDGEFTTTNEE